MRGLSHQDEVICYLRKYFKEHGKMPSQKTIEFDLKIGNGTLGRIFARLVRNGSLKKVPPTFPIRYYLNEKEERQTNGTGITNEQIHGN